MMGIIGSFPILVAYFLLAFSVSVFVDDLLCNNKISKARCYMAGRDERKLHDAHSVGFWVSASAVIPSLLVYDYHTGKERLTAGRGGGFWCLVFVFGFCKNRRRASERSLCRLYHTSELGLGVVAFTATPFAFFISYSQSSHFFSFLVSYHIQSLCWSLLIMLVLGHGLALWKNTSCSSIYNIILFHL